MGYFGDVDVAAVAAGVMFVAFCVAALFFWWRNGRDFLEVASFFGEAVEDARVRVAECERRADWAFERQEALREAIEALQKDLNKVLVALDVHKLTDRVSQQDIRDLNDDVADLRAELFALQQDFDRVTDRATGNTESSGAPVPLVRPQDLWDKWEGVDADCGCCGCGERFLGDPDVCDGWDECAGLNCE